MKKVGLILLVVLLLIAAGCLGSGDGGGNKNGDGNGPSDSIDNTAPAISSISVSDISENSAIITWMTDENSTSTIEYGLTTSYSSTHSDSMLVSSHSVALSGLSPSTTYHYRVRSTDSVGNEAVSADYTFTTLSDTAPPAISSIATSSVTTNSAVITWATDEPSTSQVEYGTTPAYGSSEPSTLDTTADIESHEVVLSGLTSGTTYYYRVKSKDAYNNEAVSADHTFTTVDVIAPSIGNIVAVGIGGDRATIEWDTDEDATSQVEYGITSSYGSTTVLDHTLVQAHSVSLTGLQSATTYHYQVKSADASGNEAVSVDGTFTTLDDVPPSIPANVAVITPANDNTPTFTWDAATDDGSGIAFYEVRIDSDIFMDVGNVTSYTADDVSALTDGDYTFYVRAVDNAYNPGIVGSATFYIDTTPPTTPSNVTMTTPGNDSTPTFTWDAAADATSGLECYQVSVDSEPFVSIGTEAVFSVLEAAALADGIHTFEVRGVDVVGNVGGIGSLTFNIDSVSPSAPTNIVKAAWDADNSPTFTWDAATDDGSGIAFYEVRIDSDIFMDVGNVTSYTYGAPIGSHVFEVRVVDEAGNIGAAGSLAFNVIEAYELVGGQPYWFQYPWDKWYFEIDIKNVGDAPIDFTVTLSGVDGYSATFTIDPGQTRGVFWDNIPSSFNGCMTEFQLAPYYS